MKESVMRKFTVTAILFLAAMQAFAQGAKSPQQLVEAYKSALLAKDFQAYMSLVSLSKEQDRSAIEWQFRERANAIVTSAKILPFSAYEAQYKQAVSQGAKPTIDPKGWLLVEFAPNKLPGGVVSTYKDVLIFGLRNGRYYFGS
jgi:hypothetical protein